MIQTKTTQLLQNSVEKAISYPQYLAMVADLVAQNKATGNTQSEALSNYTSLNYRRMLRLGKTLKISGELQQKIVELPATTWLVLTESWCGDAAQILPMLFKITELNPYIDLKIVLRDENPELMDAYLTRGARAIPKVIFLDQSLSTINKWGPRPSTATAFVASCKEKYGSVTPSCKEELQKWYNKDKGNTIISDILALFA